jgi:DNA invertase Pin-like site-specific DNA recombinase
VYNGKDSFWRHPDAESFGMCSKRGGKILSSAEQAGRDPARPLTEFRMDVMKVLAELRQERQQLEEAIMTLERLARSRGKRRGRPPAWLSQSTGGGAASAAAVVSGEPKRRGRPPGSKNKPAVVAAQ